MTSKQTKYIEKAEKVVDILDEHTDFFCKRIEYIQQGQYKKAKFIDEKILPAVKKRLIEAIKEEERAYPK